MADVNDNADDGNKAEPRAKQHAPVNKEGIPLATDLEAVFDVPVRVQAVLGRAQMEVNDLIKLKPGAVLSLDRSVCEAVDTYVNNRLVVRGAMVVNGDKLGGTVAQISKDNAGRT